MRVGRVALAVFFLGIVLVCWGSGTLYSQTEIGLSQGLVAHWTFDEGEGEIVFDETGNGNDGTIHGATWVVGKIGSALAFDGNGDYMYIPASPSLNKFTDITVLMWIKVEKVEHGAYEFLYKRGSFILYCYVAGEVPAVRAFVKVDGIDYNSLGSDAFTYGEWHQIGFIFGDFDRTGMTKLGNIIDGEISNSTPVSGSIDASTGNMIINKRKLHKGLVDEVRIYNRALTEDEIKELYQQGQSEE